MSSKFNELGLDNWLVNQCKEIGVVQPTEIQTNCIPEILKGKDCIGCAKTGCGKTAAFALPIVQKLSEDPYGVFSLVLTPTRELAFQIADQFRGFGKSININVAVVIGGMDMVKQGQALSNKPHIVVATPGRLAALLETENLCSLKKIKFLVMDEADRLLEKSFEKDLEVIFSKLPTKRQTLLFSATLTDTIEELQSITENKPFVYEVKSDFATVSELDQRYLLIPQQVKDCYLVHLVQNFIETKSIMIFTKTCRSCQVIYTLLRKLELKSACLHSFMSQRDRLGSLSKFKTGVVNVLVATDVASRGLDIPLVELVINYNVPSSPKDYIHRVGRTARAGRGGLALTLLSQYDVQRLQAIEEHTKLKMEEFTTNEADVLKLLKTVSVVKREVEIRLNDGTFGDRQKNNKRKHGITMGYSAKPKNKLKKVQKEASIG